MSLRRTNLLLSVCVLLSLVLQPLSAVAAVAPDAEPLSTAASDAPLRPGFLFRATVSLDSVRTLARLQATGALVLHALGSEQTALVLVDGDQLSDLARLGYRPRGADELRSLLGAQGPARRWLAEGLEPLLVQADVIAAQQSLVGAAEVAGAAAAPDAAALASLRAGVQSLTPEQIAATTSSISLDDDADGLTNTEEAWWCTDPLNPNSDGDASGYTDGQEVEALLDFTLSRTVRWGYGPPFGPPAAWPNFNDRNGTGVNVCNDGDYDTIPDYAEAYVVGTRVGTGDSENTDGDKFDDGQELFGTTFCPGGTASCAWGNYPRTQDYSFITSGMPSWIRPPGDSPFVAAYPVIDFLVDPATVKVTAKEIRTIERTITQGEEISTGFAETVGNSTTVGTVDTNTHSTWQENSTTEGGIEPASAASSLSVVDPINATSNLAGVTGVRLPEANEVGGAPAALPAPTPLITPTIALDVDLAEATETALYDAKAVLPRSQHYAITGIDIMGDWQFISVAGLVGVSDLARWNVLDSGNWYGLVLVHTAADGSISAAAEGTAAFTELLSQVPDNLLPQSSKLALDPLSSSNQCSIFYGYQCSTSYRLPWELNKQWEFGARSVHFAEYGYPDTAGWVAVDVGILGYGASKPASNTAYAAHDSIVGWKCDTDPNSHAYKIGNFIYAHLEPTVTLTTAQVFRSGQAIGPLKKGNITSGGCGYATQGDNQFHLHWGFPNTGSLQVSGWTLQWDTSLNDTCWGGSCDKEAAWTRTGKMVATGGRLSAEYFDGSDDIVCSVSNLMSSQAAPPTSLNQEAKTSSFFERLGQSVRNLLGKLVRGGGAGALSIAETSLSGCSTNSCSDQVGLLSSNSWNFSDDRTAGQCPSSPGTGDGSDGWAGGGGSGIAINNNGDGTWDKLRVWSQTQTTGEGWSTSHSELRSETSYREITRSQTNTLVSSEAWSTATTTDPTDAGQLTFNYNLYNTGSDAVVNLTGVRINVLIGDLPVITWNAPDRSDILPSQAKGPFGSDPLTLTLEQLAAIDNGAPIRVVLADYGYDDNLYDANAWGRSVLFHVDDGAADGDETVDTYLITTNLVQGEAYQDTLARYFDVTTFQGAPGDERNGTITGIRTPEFAGDGEITGWQDHPVNEHAWWEISISFGGETDGVQHFRDMPAKARTDVYLRYVLDTDADGFSDRAELDAGSDPNDPDIHPRPLLTVAQHTTVSGSSAAVQVTLQNDGNLDASSVELWAIAPDDSITISDNLVGGGGRVRAGRQVVLGARIGKPDLTAWTTSTAKPYPDGQFQGASPKNFKFQALDSGNVGSGTLRVRWSNDNGATWQPTPLALGSGYTAWTPLPLSDGLTIAFSGGYIALNETFTFATALPIDTFAYTINRTPYTPPLIVVSYNDPQGNHKFVSDVELADIQADLAPYLGDMRYGFQLDVMGAAPFAAGTNTAYLVFNNPAARAISGANLYIEFSTPDGTVAKEYVLANQTLLPGPNVATLAWDTADFSPAFDPAVDYHILVFAADRQGTIFENTVKDLDQVGKDRLPAAVLPQEDWNFGTAQQGTLLRHTLAVANTGYRDMLTFVAASDPAIGLSDQGSRTVADGDVTQYEIALNTADLPVGPVDQTITIRASDPDNPMRTVHVAGTVTAAPADTPVGAMQRPLDWSATASGTQGQWVEFTHALGPEPQTLHPVKVYSQDYGTLKGVGKYATPFSAGTASYDMFGDGRDGVMPTNGNLNDDHGVGIAIVNSGSAGAYSISVTDTYAGWRINTGDVVLIHQTQGTGAGCWELNKAAANYEGGTTIQVTKPLQCNYFTSGNNHAQIQRVPQYTNCSVSGTVTPLYAWNGSSGGILAVMCNGTMNVSGSISAKGVGYRGGVTGPWIDNTYSYSGDGVVGPSIKQRTANGNGGGGGRHKAGRSGGGGGGGYAGSGANGNPSSEGDDNGYGGNAAGVADLTNAIFGGGGGGGGHSDENNNGGAGGAGGGLVFLFASQFQLSGTIVANGNNGANSTYQTFDDGGGGGGGAGGAILVRSATASLGVNRLTATGGYGGVSTQYGGSGGVGSVGRIRIEYCEVPPAFSTNPPANTQKLTCYIADQATDPTHGLLNLPASGANTYQVQYGRKLDFTSAVTQTVTSLRVPAADFASVKLDALISNVGTGALTFKLDIGNDGSWDWNVTPSVTDSATLTNTVLAHAFNTYWATHGAPLSGTVDVPVKVYLSKAGQVLLTNLQVLSTGSKLRAVRLPIQPQGYDDVQVGFTVSGGSDSLAVGADVGDDGTVDWAYSGTPADPAALTTDNIAAAVNAYMAGESGEVDVPIRFYLAPFATLALTGFTAVPAGATDAGLSNTDLTFGAATPSEGDVVTVTAIVHNAESLNTGPLAVSFYATPAGGIETRIGSAFVANVPAAGTATVPLQWNTLGFTGDVPVRAVADPYNRLVESSETNNSATTTLPIKTRPDLRVTEIALSEAEPVVGQAVAVTLTLRNEGQTAVGASVLALYDDHPDDTRVLVCADGGGTPADTTRTLVCQWTPTTPGLHRLFAQADRDGVVKESSEGNNDAHRGIYVGFAGPILLDSGGGDVYDPAYTVVNGFGYLDGEPSTFCGTEPDKTQRSDYDAQLQYRFDHLLPGHFYHVDVTLFECDGTGRQEKISVDGNIIEPLVDLADGAVHRLSYLLDPAFYGDRSILVSFAEINGYDVVVSEVNLYDVDYRYSDAGGGNDPAYSAATTYGWLDGVAQTTWGTLPYQSRRTDTPDSNPADDPDNELRYRYDRLDPARRYQLRVTVYQGSGTATVIQGIAVDEVDTGTSITVVGVQRQDVTLGIPPGTYAGDSSVVVRIIRTNASANAFANEIALEELTLSQGSATTQNLALHATSPNWISFNVKPAVRPALYCSGVTATSAFTTLAGDAFLAGEGAPVNSIVEAYTPAGVKVGCYKVTSAGKYGYMRVYGAEGATPGMAPGEPIRLKINGIASQPSPYPVIWQNDKLTHIVDLAAADVIPVETFLDPIAGRVVKLQSETGTYLPPPADPRFNTSTTVAPGWGYLLYTNAAATMAVMGDRIPADTPLALHAGWNWLGYLPTCELPVATALADIAGQYDLLHNEVGTYRPPPADPAYNTFNTMSPGKGYMIHMTTASTLTYAAAGCGAALLATEAPTAPALTCPAAATSRFTHFYGHVTPAEDAPVGATILARSPRGEIVGCGQVQEGGLYPYLRVYGAEDAQPGMLPGETVRFTVNGRLVLPSAAAIWQNDWDVHPLDLALDGVRYGYLPMIAR